MKSFITLALALAGTLVTAQASAGKFVAGDLAQPYMTYGTTAQITSSRTTAFSGVGSLFVSYASTRTTGLGSICTGSLIGSNTVLTAAHCLATTADNPVIGINFYLPSFGDRRGGAEIFAAANFAINPDYAITGLTGGNDVALFNIAGNTSAYDKYDLYLGNPLRQFTEVGTGTIGGPNGTGYTIDASGNRATVASDYYKRTGNNLYEYYGDDVFSDVSHGVVLYDFDDGTAAHDVFGRNGGNSQLGVLNEASASPGDSGGPEFIDGKIASVTSFGVTGGIFDGYCGGNSTDPYNKSGTTTVASLGNCTNSSVGEIGGNTLVSYNIDFIRGVLSGTVATTSLPEPASWAMMIGGFGFVGAAMRRRKVRIAFA